MKVKMPSYALITEFSLPLILGIITALVLRNGFPTLYQSIVEQSLFTIGAESMTVKQVINDVFMAFFFGLAVKEIIEATRPNGCLCKPIKALNPIIATIGGVLAPVGIYLLLTQIFLPDAGVLPGIAIPIATDIAFAWLGARLIFGSCHPAIQYLLLLAILDDTIGMTVLAIFYPDPSHPIELNWLLLTFAGMITALIFRVNGLKQWFPYIVVGGLMSWIGMFKAGLHPALSLAFIVPLIPGPATDTGLYIEKNPEDHIPLYDFEHNMKPIIDFGLFFFGVVNAGVSIAPQAFSLLAIIIVVSQVAGKFIGISTMAFIAHKMGVKLPEGISMGTIRLIAMTAGVNITVSLFLADRVFGGTQFENSAKLGALLTLVVPFSILAFQSAKKVIAELADTRDNNKHFVH